MDVPDVQITLQLENGRVTEPQEAHTHAGPQTTHMIYTRRIPGFSSRIFDTQNG
jgi:hypothetical protein